MNIDGNPNPQGGTRISVGLEHGATPAPSSLIVPIQEEPEIVPTSTASVDVGPTLSYLTPDAMLIYCQTRLSGIDTQCKDIMAKQQANSRTQAALGDLLSSLLHYQEGYMDSNPRAQQELVRAYQTAIDTVGADSVVGKKLAENRSQWLLTDGNDITSKEEMGSLINSTKSLQSDLNSNAELDMIHLQSLMSQRQTAIQLTTNILQSLNEQANKIVANIGR